MNTLGVSKNYLEREADRFIRERMRTPGAGWRVDQLLVEFTLQIFQMLNPSSDSKQVREGFGLDERRAELEKLYNSNPIVRNAMTAQQIHGLSDEALYLLIASAAI